MNICNSYKIIPSSADFAPSATLNRAILFFGSESVTPSSLHSLTMPLLLRFQHEKHSGVCEAVLPA
ncbi:MAG: hypothetical protein A2079_08295 [Geobacteraceae bacterium GWC2_48_7]|nr:MAG: hypothetical protein A2079_08295 [Geobacteraceae bacterium GWC2_48_7]